MHGKSIVKDRSEGKASAEAENKPGRKLEDTRGVVRRNRDGDISARSNVLCKDAEGAIPGRDPELATNREGISKLKGPHVYGGNIMSARMFEMPLSRVGAVRRLEREAWSLVK